MSDDIHVVTAFECRPGETQRFFDLMRVDYELIARDPALVSAALLASRSQPNAWFHVTHWSSSDALAKVVAHPTVRDVFASLPLLAPPSSHACDAHLVASEGTVALTPLPH